ncbi:MAG: BspA family leucine-rich repeat surface protein, partial [Lachnospiraceae bacterium]|nr:BspA family leucine-rich repeat surface protein [Lachnospiraceae bacterium]
TVELIATVTPSYATNATVTWESSDDSVATVEDGVVTAVSEGICIITASAGTEIVTCTVTVTAKNDDGNIASGSYGDITWVIDQDGKLTVTGTGEFTSDTDASRRAPWGYEYRESITSAEINVTGMTDASYMFYECANLVSVDVSCLDTTNVTRMNQMFEGCRSLTSLDLGNFDTGKVADMHGMFRGCSSLTELDLSNFDVKNVLNMSGIFSGCTGLSTMNTPCNLTLSVELPRNSGDIWYQPDGTAIDTLPQNLSYSVKLTKNDAPTTKKEPYITAEKTKTTYQCGDSVNTDDLLVTYYDSEGTATIVTDYYTNVLEISTYSPGTRTLIVMYNGLRAYVTLTVTMAKPDPSKMFYRVTFNLQGHGTALPEYATYTEIQWGSIIKCPTSPQAEGYKFTGWYKDAACRTLWFFEKNTITNNITLYAGWEESEEVEKKPLINSVQFPKQQNEYSAVYTGEQIRPVMIVAYQYTDDKGKATTQKLKLNADYTVCYSNNVNAGENTAKVTVTGIGEYAGSITKEFTIEPKSISNVTLSPVGDIVFGEKPSVRVTDGTRELVEDGADNKGDYMIHLSTDGTADEDTQSTLTVEGKGNYTGTSKKSVKFNILKKETGILSIADENILVEFKKFPAKGYTYNGKEQKPGVVVTDTTTGKKLSSSMYKVIYSNNINAGEETAKAWVVGVSKNGKGYYGESAPLSFTINQKDFSKVSVSLSSAIPKTGILQDVKKAISEAILVKEAKHVLSEDEYRIDYGDIETMDHIRCGKQYQITLTPKAGGNYIKDSQKVIKIKFGQLNLASKTADISAKITNASQNEIELRYNGILLEEGRDYVATVKQDKNKNTYTVKVNAVKNSAYKGSRTFKNMEFDPESIKEVLEIPADPDATPAVSYNREKQDYDWTTADTVKSYLYENQTGGLTRVEYINGEIVAEDYNDSFEMTASRKIPMELPVWGGFYAGENYNFLFFGQKNPSEDDNTEVVRVVKYSKNWKRLGDVKLRGANTVVPFYAGSLRCAEYDDYLYIRTSHKMYASKRDGINHQANMTLVVRQSDMKITDSYYKVGYNGIGYVSHSFNQFVLVDQDKNLVTLDHGDAYPRSIVLMRLNNVKAGGNKFSGTFENSELKKFPGEIGDNATGASIGGFAETENGYVTAFNYNETGNGYDPRAIYLGYTSKKGLKSQAVPITAYDGLSNPVLAPTGLDGGYLMWTDSKGVFNYTRYADGGTTSTISIADAALSDCQPILHNGALVWYVTINSVPAFFTLDVSSSEISWVWAK